MSIPKHFACFAGKPVVSADPDVRLLILARETREMTRKTTPADLMNHQPSTVSAVPSSIDHGTVAQSHRCFTGKPVRQLPLRRSAIWLKDLHRLAVTHNVS